MPWRGFHYVQSIHGPLSREIVTVQVGGGNEKQSCGGGGDGGGRENVGKNSNGLLPDGHCYRSGPVSLC